uniref:Uncharacterized protein n=1 Tax=Candidatus Kentrum sp. LFY TaxID=2126342 RepID=A0A450VC37_9GAMM|nr:MAG: hypothetical protein BECKLFY1418A_GA0070994_11922 [Candidatus Kentron sp. LFY]
MDINKKIIDNFHKDAALLRYIYTLGVGLYDKSDFLSKIDDFCTTCARAASEEGAGEVFLEKGEYGKLFLCKGSYKIDFDLAKDDVLVFLTGTSHDLYTLFMQMVKRPTISLEDLTLFPKWCGDCLLEHISQDNS